MSAKYRHLHQATVSLLASRPQGVPWSSRRRCTRNKILCVQPFLFFPFLLPSYAELSTSFCQESVQLSPDSACFAAETLDSRAGVAWALSASTSGSDYSNCSPSPSSSLGGSGASYGESRLLRKEHLVTVVQAPQPLWSLAAAEWVQLRWWRSALERNKALKNDLLDFIRREYMTQVLYLLCISLKKIVYFRALRYATVLRRT